MKNKETEMNDKYHKQSFALRAIYEERACPPDNVLRQQSEEIRSHLGYCRYCNERLETVDSDSKEWQELVQHMRPALVSENNNKEIVSPGQIWSLDSSHLGGWGPYDRFYTPPLVVVLEIRDQGKTARVAQLCGYTELMGDDGVDVYLESAGFAESWNVYSVPRQYLKQCRGNVGLISVEKILLKSRYQPQQAETSQIIKQFRELEIQVGAFMAMQALPQVMEAVEKVEEWEAVSMGAALPQQEFIKGIFLKVTTAGEIALTMAHEALLNVRDALRVGPFESMAPARSVELLQSKQTLSTEFLEFIGKMKEQNVPFVPFDIYTADDSTYIPVFKTTTAESEPELIVTYKSTVIDRKRIFFECWETDHTVIVIKDFWISKSKIQQAARLFEIVITDGKVKIDIIPE